MTSPSPYELWEQSGHDGEKYRALMREHGLLIPLAPGEKAEPLPCGWPARRVADSLLARVLNRMVLLAKDHPSLRVGQVAFLALQDVAPDVAARIGGTVRDPFHDDELLDDFLAAVDAADMP